VAYAVIAAAVCRLTRLEIFFPAKNVIAAKKIIEKFRLFFPQKTVLRNRIRWIRYQLAPGLRIRNTE